MWANYRGHPYCCGIAEIGGFGNVGYGVKITKKVLQDTRLAFTCVTRWSDVTYKAKLKKWGFRRVGRWKNPNTGRMLTLWAYLPKQEKK